MKTVYICEGCGKEFSDYKDCIQHENSHIKPKYAVATHYLIGNEKDVPMKVLITMDDGRKAIYSFEEMIWDSIKI